MVTYSSLPESGSLKTGSLAPWRKQTITPTTRGSADDSAERGVSTATAGANATTAPAARRRSIARARAIRRLYPVPARTCRAIEGKASKQAQAAHASTGKQIKVNLRKGQLNRHARESGRSARSAPRPPLVHTKHRLAAAVASRAELVSSETRHTGANHFSLPTFILVHDTTTRRQSHTVLGWARRGTPPVSNFASVGSVFRPRSLRSTQARHASYTGSHPGLSQWSLHLAILVSSILIMTASDRPEDGRTYTMFTRCATAAEAKYTRARCQNCSPRDPSWSC